MKPILFDLSLCLPKLLNIVRCCSIPRNQFFQRSRDSILGLKKKFGFKGFFSPLRRSTVVTKIFFLFFFFPNAVYFLCSLVSWINSVVVDKPTNFVCPRDATNSVLSRSIFSLASLSLQDYRIWKTKLIQTVILAGPVHENLFPWPLSQTPHLVRVLEHKKPSSRQTGTLLVRSNKLNALTEFKKKNFLLLGTRWCTRGVSRSAVQSCQVLL